MGVDIKNKKNLGVVKSVDLISLCRLAPQQLPLNSHLCHCCSRLLVQESWTGFRNSVESGDYWSMVRL